MSSPPQVATLVKIGVPQNEAEKMTSRAASKTIGWAQIHRKRGLCTYKQFRELLRLGVPEGEAQRISFQGAIARLDKLKGPKS